MTKSVNDLVTHSESHAEVWDQAVGNLEYITVENCLLWSDRARVFLLGHESRAEYMRHIVLRNLDILHFNMTPFLFEPGEEMSIEDVIVEKEEMKTSELVKDVTR